MTKETGRDNEWDMEYLDIDLEMKKGKSSSFLGLITGQLSDEDMDDIMEALEDEELFISEVEESIV